MTLVPPASSRRSPSSRCSSTPTDSRRSRTSRICGLRSSISGVNSTAAGYSASVNHVRTRNGTLQDSYKPTRNEQESGSSPLVGSLHFVLFAGKSQRKVTDGNGLPIGLELANANHHEVKLAVPILQTV